MSANPFPPIGSGFNWVDPVTNVDNSPVVAGEISGYSLGIRPDSGTAGTYPINASVASPTATSEALSAIGTILAPGNYWAAIKALGGPTANDSAYTAELGFSVPVPPIPTLNPPSNFSAT